MQRIRGDEVARSLSRPGANYWLIEGDEKRWSRALTIEQDGAELLPIFSFEEEARMFALGAGRGRNLRKTSSEELISLLMGPYSGIGSVALDPMPEKTSKGMLRLVSLSRRRFLSHLAEKIYLENGKPDLSKVAQKWRLACVGQRPGRSPRSHSVQPEALRAGDAAAEVEQTGHGS